MNRSVAAGVMLAIVLCGVTAPGAQTPRDAPRPIAAGTSLWAEELTWMEIRDLLKAGTTTIIIGTGSSAPSQR